MAFYARYLEVEPQDKTQFGWYWYQHEMMPVFFLIGEQQGSLRIVSDVPIIQIWRISE